jgi:hypothetical protein
VDQFRNRLIESGERLRADDMIICGGVADAQGGFTNSTAFNVISQTRENEITTMQVVDPVSSGQGSVSFYYDLCSSGEERGVIDRARFQVSSPISKI